MSFVPPPRQQPHKAANLLRDQLDLSTWLALGALVQLLLSLLPLSRYASAVPVLAFTSYKLLHFITSLSAYRPGKDGAIIRKVTVDYRDDVKSNGGICIVLLGFKSHHPLGLLAPHAREAGDYLDRMTKDLVEHADEFDYLGGQSWINSSDATSGNEMLGTFYFRDPEGLRKFAHSAAHRDGWEWWNKHVSEVRHLGIFHETYDCQEGHWGSVYINYKPTGAATTSFAAVNENGKKVWASPIVDAPSHHLIPSQREKSRSDRNGSSYVKADPV